MTADRSTMTDLLARRSWRIRDAVVRLRQRAADRVYGLPDPPIACKMGTASELLLHDPTGTVSRAHAELVPIEIDGALLWKIHDMKSKNGLRCDGERLGSCLLRPGIEVSLGSLRLIAESLQLIDLLSVLRRFLGWAAEQQEQVEQALRTLRDWAAQRVDLVVVGDGNLMPIVRRLHDIVIGEDVSFTWYEPKEAEAEAAATMKTAATGTLCVRVQRQADALTIVERFRETEHLAKPQFILCTADPTIATTVKGSLERSAVIHVPPLASRATELEEIIREYAGEIAQQLRLPGPRITDRDVEQLLLVEFNSLAEVEDDARRLVTLRTWGGPAGAAKLGMDRGSLRSWAQRRGLDP